MPQRQVICFEGKKQITKKKKKSSQLAIRVLGVWRLTLAHKKKMQQDATEPLVGCVSRNMESTVWESGKGYSCNIVSSMGQQASRKMNTSLNYFLCASKI